MRRYWPLLFVPLLLIPMVDGAIPPANTWKTIFVNSDNVTAQTTFDTLTFIEGSGMTITPDFSNSEITFASSGGSSPTELYCSGTDKFSSYNSTTNTFTCTTDQTSGGSGDIITEGDSNVEVIDLGTGTIEVDIDGTTEYNFTSTALYFNSNSIADVKIIESDGTVATTGFIRVQNNQPIAARNFANTDNHFFSFNGADDLAITLNSVGEYAFSDESLNMIDNYIIGSMGCASGKIIQYNSTSNRWECENHFVVLQADGTANNPAAYVSVFVINLPVSSGSFIEYNLVVSSDTAGVAPQFRSLFNNAGNSGYCTYTNYDTATTSSLDTIAIGGGDTAETVWLPAINVPSIIKVSCALVTDSTPGQIALQVQPEVAGVITVHRGSYYMITP